MVAIKSQTHGEIRWPAPSTEPRIVMPPMDRLDPSGSADSIDPELHKPSSARVVGPERVHLDDFRTLLGNPDLSYCRPEIEFSSPIFGKLLLTFKEADTEKKKRLSVEEAETEKIERVSVTARYATGGTPLGNSAIFSPVARFGLPDYQSLLELLGYAKPIDEDVRVADLQQAISDGADRRAGELSRTLAGTRISEQELAKLVREAEKCPERILYFGIAEYTAGAAGIEAKNYRYLLRIGEHGHFDLISLCEGIS